MDQDILGLRNWRMQKGITLDSIALATKLSIRLLQAIEAGDFKKLPGGIYNTNYIKQYARAIAFDEAELLAYYHDTNRSAAKESRPEGRRSIAGPLFQH